MSEFLILSESSSESRLLSNLSLIVNLIMNISKEIRADDEKYKNEIKEILTDYGFIITEQSFEVLSKMVGSNEPE